LRQGLRKGARHGLETTSGEATNQNETKQSNYLTVIDKPCSFKRLVQENPNGKERLKDNHEKHVRNLTAEISVTREEFDQQ